MHTIISRFRNSGPWVLGLVLLLSFIYLQSILTPSYPNAHEHETYPLRTMILCKAIGEGQWDGRWSSCLAGGYGYPFFNYYAPGFYYVCALIHSGGFNFVSSTKAAVCLFTFLGITGIFCLARFLWRSSLAGGLSAAIWTFFPYRIVNLYVRGDLAELSAMSLSPWAILGHLAMIRGTGWSGVILAAAANAAVIWTHNISALLLQPFLVAIDLLFLWSEKARPKLAWKKLLTAHLLALALGAAFWMPALFEKNRAHIDQVKLQGTAFDLSRHFLYPIQLLIAHWGWGVSVEGPVDGMPFQIGSVALGAGLIGLIMAMRSASEQSHRRALALMLLSAASILMMLNVAAPVWKWLPLAGYVQFPWRLFMLVALTLPILAGAAAATFEKSHRWLGYAFLGAIAFAAPYSMSGNMRPYTRMELNDHDFEAKLSDGYVTTTQMNEYLPISVPFAKKPIAARAQELDAPPSASVEKVSPATAFPPAYHMQLATTSTLTWRHYYFPGWRVTANGRDIAADASPEGFIRFSLPAGAHEVRFVFRDTPLRAAAKTISVIAIIFVLGVVWRHAWGKYRPRNPINLQTSGHSMQ